MYNQVLDEKDYFILKNLNFSVKLNALPKA